MKKAIKPIHSEKDYDAALKRIEAIWGAKHGTPEGDELEILFALVEAYDKEHYSIPPPTLQQAVEFYMDQHGLTRTDLAKMLGGKSRVSELLSGKRTPSVRMMKVLHRELGIPADILLGD
ncbi:MAG TPA: helix-turn-helix domain-containing protein [Candidatus Kapabacteria bacterium]|nr:helix-turn-helix domain-containing protein [Candidatus Kapabacteria bacterium]